MIKELLIFIGILYAQGVYAAKEIRIYSSLSISCGLNFCNNAIERNIFCGILRS